MDIGLALWGTFEGKEEIKHYLIWIAKNIQGKTVTDIGIGNMAQGNKAFD